jgi:agmatinase
MIRQNTSLPHTGIATFAKAAYVPNLDDLDADMAVLGVPFDGMASMRPGCRQAPRALRDASARFGWLGRPEGSSGFFDIGSNRTWMKGVRLADVGDVDVSLDAERTRSSIKALVGDVLRAGAMPVILGGDHSISFPAIQAFEEFGPLTVVLIDAHLDYRDTFLGLKFSNNSPFRRAHELGFIKQIIAVGVRGIKSTDQEYRESLAHGNLNISADQVHDQGVASVLESLPTELGNYYLSIDIDGLDPSIAPGTESPEAEGLTFTEVKRFLRGIGARGRMVGLDLVEVNPYLDHAELTQHIAVQITIEAIAAKFVTQKGEQP